MKFIEIHLKFIEIPIHSELSLGARRGRDQIDLASALLSTASGRHTPALCVVHKPCTCRSERAASSLTHFGRTQPHTAPMNSRSVVVFRFRPEGKKKREDSERICFPPTCHIQPGQCQIGCPARREVDSQKFRERAVRISNVN